MKLTFLGAAREVAGSRFLLEACQKRIMVDYGMEQGVDLFENAPLPIMESEIDCVLLTHAHIDHSGRLPLLSKLGFSGQVVTTDATADLCRIMLRDSAHIQEFEAQWRNRKAQRAGLPAYEPMYTMADAEQTLTQFMAYPYGERVEVFDGVAISFIDAGHLLGSASIYIEVTEGDQRRTLLFSGDLGNRDRPLIRDPQMPPEADFVVIESTYGDRTHGPRPDYVSQLSRILQDTFDRGGNVVIPSFAIGRTQELLYLIRVIREQKLLRGHQDFGVYVDSPLAVEATRIYSSGLTDYYDEETLELLSRGIDPISFPGLRLSVTSDESKLINEDRSPKVILSASGMCEAGRIRHHLKHNLWRPDSTVLFVGYQAEGTVGRKLVDGADSVRLFGEEIAVRCHIEVMAGISGHADRDMMLEWLGHRDHPPKKVFVNHGDDEVCDHFAAAVTEKLGYTATAPFSGDEFDLITGECTARGVVVKITKVSDGRRRANTIFEKLLAAGKRLLAVIQSSKGLSNKELARFTDQVNQLCDKYEKK